jgi:predicted metal-dependent HD superfamily phosphohydrolase
MEMFEHFTVESAMDHLGLSDHFKSFIVNAYAQDHRKYHTLDHLNKMLRWVPPTHPALESILEGILWHDFHYPLVKAPPGLFEAQSICEYILACHINGYSGHEIQVVAMINASSRHLEDQKNLSEETKFFLDLDLENFSRPWDEFNTASNLVRDELLPLYGEEDFLKGHKWFLGQLLKRERIFYTAMNQWEWQARSNIHRRIMELGE